MTTHNTQTTQTTKHNSATQRDAWDSIASGYDRYVTPENVRHGEEIIRTLDLGPGTRLLDVASGSGALSLPAARRGARVLAVDISGEMLERLTARARAEGLAGIDTAVMDGQSLDLPDDSFDAAVSQHGVSLFDDVDAGLAELVRVTRPGGTVVISAFGDLREAEFLGFFVSAVRAVVPDFAGLPTDPPPPPFQLAQPDVLRRRLVDAGLRDVSVRTITWRLTVDSATRLWKLVTSSNPIGARLVAGLTEQQRADALGVLDGVLRERSGAAPEAVLHTSINVGTGTK
ncbi:methylase involved in ubiquinone/menaquinone biosynthesis [Saccharomonospora marina XMU15]|uniref:Methylase involved in ubiquinone/menaquinone biosynthesis n=1 Tax=Saccharomonospora marina XMU15 TaxID=882083 RepID=H5X8I9_9PSEU|nr:methyltransferase domain-containing protein [Saccharomonospora marina]EHR50285.1 methylase involved in ubiquinone/menaquinone biosynthesis [Saccharomonospora marina XMU15]